MRSSRVSVVAMLAALAAALLVASAAATASAAVNYNSSKSNSGNFTFDPTDPAAVEKCKGLDGSAVKQPDGTTMCVLAPCPAGEVRATDPATGVAACVTAQTAARWQPAGGH